MAAPISFVRGEASPQRQTGPCTTSIGFAVCVVDPAKSAAAGDTLPLGDEATTNYRGEPIWLLAHVELSESDVASAGTDVDPVEGPVVLVTFTEKGAQKLSALTAATEGRNVAMLIDGVVVCVPYVAATLRAGRAEISGGFTAERAKALADRINAARPTSGA
jgi:preprotein translocase subunit SecD